MADPLNQDDAVLLKQYIQEVLAEQGGTPAAPVQAPAPVAPEPMKLNLGGQEYTFKDTNELQNQVNQVLQMAQAQVAQATKPVAAAPKGDDAPSFNFDHYAELMTKGDVPKGLEYGMQAVLGVENPGKAFKELMAKTERINNELTAYQFQARHPEIATLPPQVGATIDKLRRDLNLPFDVNGLDAAYEWGKARGFIPQSAPAAPPPQAPPPVETNPYMAPMPNVNRGGDNTANFGDMDLENMSIAQLEALQRKLLPR